MAVLEHRINEVEAEADRRHDKSNARFLALEEELRDQRSRLDDAVGRSGDNGKVGKLTEKLDTADKHLDKLFDRVRMVEIRIAGYIASAVFALWWLLKNGG